MRTKIIVLLAMGISTMGFAQKDEMKADSKENNNDNNNKQRNKRVKKEVKEEEEKVIPVKKIKKNEKVNDRRLKQLCDEGELLQLTTDKLKEL